MSISKSDSFFIRIISYTNERFPIIPILLFSAFITVNGAFSGLYLFTDTIVTKFSASLVLGLFSNFLMMFHLRLMDEFKDYDEDVIAYPDRLLSRGVVTLKDLKLLLIACIGIEFVLNLFIGAESLILWFMVFIYSFLMFKEFFIEKILNKSMALYLVSHQLILPIIALYCFSLSTDLNMDQLLSLKSAAAILLISLPSFIFEIGRKTWNPEREQQTADSYTKVWGIKKTVVVINLATLIYGMVAGAFFSTQFFMSYSGMIFILLLFLTIIISSVFAYKPTAKNSKMVEGVTSAVLLLGHLLCVIYFI